MRKHEYDDFKVRVSREAIQDVRRLTGLIQSERPAAQVTQGEVVAMAVRAMLDAITGGADDSPTR